MSLWKRFDVLCEYKVPPVLGRILVPVAATVIVTFVGLFAFSMIEHRYRLWRDFAAVSHVKLVLYTDALDMGGVVTNRTYTTYLTTERRVIKELWTAMDAYRPVVATGKSHGSLTGTRPFARLQYPVTLSTGDAWECPVTLYPDGTSFWGVAPKADRLYKTPRLNAYVVRLLDEIESGTNVFRFVTVESEKPMATFQEFIDGHR